MTGAPRRRVTVLGATGSVGLATVDLLERHASLFAVEAVVANSDAAGLAAVARRLNARRAVVSDASAGPALAAALEGSGVATSAGAEAAVEAAALPVDWTMAAISGAAGLAPTIAAVRQGGAVALATKECLVCAGAAFMREVATAGATLLPVDSEHNALLQALGGQSVDDVERMTLTASGGPFRTWEAERIARARPEDALRHPTWSMGAKITIDSATLMNKGLELIEAHHLFAIDAERLDVVVHPQSVIHGLVTFRDGAVTAGLAAADMRVPIAHALGHPQRLATPAARLDLARIGSLTFEAPDMGRFPALRLAREALAAGGAAATVLNAANEVAVAAFLAREIGFGDIPRLVEDSLEAADRQGLTAAPETIAEAIDLDVEIRSLASGRLPEARLRAH
ncbi:1-deoxy-D-xylulose-5-phosphate reductoisomerase [Methylopila capsulata]|uniref:1-deoxy-D-xylulose 5-phosphate reductoisomerase n=1 Tax=Methylopila capsulata TaxID=61654 RepID=A0A9W6IU34_9HYPH|nr:1-deoxy-D-xylulose-5-phosphate reductoisomerase [Methylopila capsulata]MBM7849910.1 1-deoxy-D-xylulose-5-phosphate reductoisomerase [Methylopila capsulata]GLK55200.1 1-deoxy-D-xylulose 5-phosphate reductoisomerase [Methylopila capsulata]